MRFGILLLFPACTLAPNPGGQFGEESSGRCEAQERTPLERDEASPLGTTPGDLLDLAEGDHPDVLTWEQLDRSTEFTFTVAYDGGAMEWVDYTYVSDNPGSLVEIGCEDTLEVEVSVILATADGAFDESFPTRLRTGGTDPWLNHALDTVTGTFDPWDHAPADHDYDEMRAWLDVAFASSGVTGVVSGQGSGVIGDPNLPDSVAFAENVDIARWGGGEE